MKAVTHAREYGGMSKLAEIKPQLPELTVALHLARQNLDSARSQPTAIDGFVASIGVQLGGNATESLLGLRMPGKRLVAEAVRQASSDRKRAADADARHSARRVVEALRRMFASSVDVPDRALEGWRTALSKLATDRTTSTKVLLGRVERLIAAIEQYSIPSGRRATRNRDEFSPTVIRTLALRVGVRCSNPSCRQLTAGPSDEGPLKCTNVGEAAHITAAAAGGPRYNPSLEPEHRGAASNGIWLCAKCARMIDRDEIKYTVEVLQKWKHRAEKAARAEVEG